MDAPQPAHYIRRMNPTTSAWVVGIRPWKQWQITPFLTPRYGRLRYLRSAEALLKKPSLAGQTIIIWAAREPAGFADAVAAKGAKLVRMEDGFLRSVGLGSNHVGGSSLVVDETGIYFDPRTPSALESMLQNEPADAALLQRARLLRQQLVQHGLTKYNVGSSTPITINARPGQRRVLVPGQVENDASLRQGSPEVQHNLALLQRVRAAEPEAWIVYKPHPDTEAGTRPGQLADADVLRHADQIVREVTVTALFPQIDLVHTMTSLVGFEALLRGLPVHTWGLPFYAGWGLSTDHLSTPRRTQRLSLDALVAGVLIRYPLYRHPHSGEPCEVEALVDALRQQAPSPMQRQRSSWRRLARLTRGLLRSLSTVRHAR